MMPDPRRLREAAAAAARGNIGDGDDLDDLLKQASANVPKPVLPQVEQLGKISLEQLHEYHCNNPKRRVVSLLGTLYDVTEANEKYGPKGSYREFAGHDVTINLGAAKMEEEWLDTFIAMKPQWIEGARNWQEFYDEVYPKCGELDKWVDEDPSTWPGLSDEQQKEFDSSCSIC